MAKAGVAAPSAAAVVTLLRVHADRVHDLALRSGCDPATAVAVVEQTGDQLIDRLAERPVVDDAVGWWFGRAVEVAGQRGHPAESAVTAVLDEDQRLLAEAVERQPEPGRTALLLRDCYDLPAAAVGTALGMSAAQAMHAVASARLIFLRDVDTEPVPPLTGHDVDLATLGRLGEDEEIAAADATTYRHAQTCPLCQAVVDGQDVARRLVAGLTVAPLPEEHRDALLGRLEAKAQQLAVTAEATASRSVVPVDGPARSAALRPVTVLLGVGAALVLGTGIGLLWRQDTALPPAEALSAAPPLVTAPPVRTIASIPPPTLQTSAPRTQVFTVAPETPSAAPMSPPATVTPVTPLTPVPAVPSLAATAPAAGPSVAVSPLAGANNQTLTVTGSGWTPLSALTLTYLDPTDAPTGAQAQATVDAQGTFVAQLAAADGNNLPGPHTVRVSDASRTAVASYDVTG